MNLSVEATAHHSDGACFFNNGLDVIRDENANGAHHTIAYVEPLLHRTGVLKALGRARWIL